MVVRVRYLDPHGMPSGGDWALQRSGAVFLQGTERCTVHGNQMVRLDGNAVFLSAYNRNATISANDVSWNGDTAFAAWGITGHCVNENCTRKLDWPVGPDGRNGEQPRGTRVVSNLVRELGIWQKQSSMWFQARGGPRRPAAAPRGAPPRRPMLRIRRSLRVRRSALRFRRSLLCCNGQAVTAQSYVAGNVHFNGPRPGDNRTRSLAAAHAIARSTACFGDGVCLYNVSGGQRHNKR